MQEDSNNFELAFAVVDTAASTAANTSKVAGSRTALRIAGAFTPIIMKKVPLLGAVVTAGFGLWEVGGHVYEGNYKVAAGAFYAGVYETVGATVGFGVGDLMREGARQTLISYDPAFAEVSKSDIRVIGEAVKETLSSGYAHIGKEYEPDTSYIPPILNPPTVEDNPPVLHSPEIQNSPLGEAFIAANPPAPDWSGHQTAFNTAVNPLGEPTALKLPIAPATMGGPTVVASLSIKN